MRLAALLCAFALASFASSQTPDPPANVIRVEVTEEVRLKADHIRIDMRLESRNADSAAAADEVATELKRVNQAFAELKIEGATLTPLPLRLVRIEREVRNPKGPPGPMEVEYKVIRPVRVEVTEADFDKFKVKVEKVLAELYTLGLKNDDDGGNPRSWYSRKDGWEGVEKDTVERAVKRGRAKADGLAASAGVSVVGLMSADVPSFFAVDAMSSLAFYQAPWTQLTPDGELAYRLRVRLEYAIRK